MDIKVKSLLIILAVVVISCKNQNKETELTNSKQEEVVTQKSLDPKIENAAIDKNKITEHLQGKWKESEYPYRTVEFVNSTVMFVEEGTQSKPIFQTFVLSDNCPFDTNNIRDLKSGDVILSLPETKRCEKLKVSNDTLTLNGFSTNTNADYNIVYLKLK